MIAFLLNAVWWFGITIPLLKNYRQKYFVEVQSHPFKESFVRIIKMLKNIRKEKGIFLFLLAFLFYIDGVYTLSLIHILDTLPLPIMGLMSDAGFEQVNELLQRMTKTAHEMGVPKGVEPFVTLSFIALPVIPEIRVTPRGLFDVTAFSFVK